MQQKPGARPLWQFHAEPMILKTIDGSPLKSGDVVLTVKGQPITTAAGAEAFTYPAAGTWTVGVRRDGREVSVTVQVSDDCAHGAGQVAPPPVSAPPPTATSHGRFGFAIACSNCTRKVGNDGIGYWTFESNPAIADLDANGPAAASGLHVGDIIEAVDSHPVLDAAGSLALAHADRAASLRLSVRRADGTRLTVTLIPRVGKGL